MTSEYDAEAMLLPILLDRARVLAAIQRPSGPLLLAFAHDVGSNA